MPRSGLAPEDEGGSLTVYLIVSLALVSLLFLASATAFVACQGLLDGFSDAHMPRSGLAPEDEGGSLTVYLIVSLALVSLLFLASATAFVACKVRKRTAPKEGTVLYGPGNFQSSLADAAGTATLPHAYCYEISLTTGSGNSEFKFLKPVQDRKAFTGVRVLSGAGERARWRRAFFLTPGESVCETPQFSHGGGLLAATAAGALGMPRRLEASEVRLQSPAFASRRAGATEPCEAAGSEESWD
nr:PREDICTED: protocadherin beta-3-like [Struthio camelus australis]